MYKKSQPTDYVLVQTSIGDYRQQVMAQLVATYGKNFKAFAGREYFYKSLTTKIDIGQNLELVNNRFLFGRRLLWQRGVINGAVAAKAVILEFNPRILSNWIILIVRRLKGVPTVLWGHAWSRSGPSSKTEVVRAMMRTLADVVLVYTEKQRQELSVAERGRARIIAAPNSLYRKCDMRPLGNSKTRYDFIYVGRLVDEKKPLLLIEAFCAIVKDLYGSRLLIVGDGPLRDQCEILARERCGEARVVFFGHVGDVRALEAIYSTVLASISPGYVGLSITQSFGFGIPMIISRNEPHAPEVEAAQAGFNCVWFETNSTDDLADKLLRVFEEREKWIAKANAISEQCRNSYSVEVMASRICEAFAYGRK